MNRAEIEHLLRNGQYSKAYRELELSKPSAWRDTFKLSCLRALGRSDDALEMAEELHKALSKDLSGYPVNSSDRNNQLRHIALVYAEHDKAPIACEIMQTLCKKAPNISDLRREYAFVLTRDEQLDRAEEQLNIALKLEPSNADSHARLGGLYCRIGNVDAGYSCYSRAAALAPDNHHYMQRLVYWSNHTERTTRQSNSQLAKLWASRRYPDQTKELPLQNGKPRNSNPDKRLKVAFILSDFYTNAVSFFLKPLLTELEQDAFTVYAYNDTRKTSAIANTLQQLCHYSHDSSQLSAQQLTEKIREDQIDVLVDLGGHSLGHRLGVFAARAAPVQLSWLGYPASTGLNNMDYRLSDGLVDPVSLNHSHYSEEIIRLPNGFLCYEPPELAPDINASNLATDTEEPIRFGSFNTLGKISRLTLDAWAAAMLAVPNSSLYLKRAQLKNQSARDYFIERFERRGIHSSRLRLEASTEGLKEHLNEYNNIDIAFDTTPYNGTTTALEALWMGVPVITLTSSTHASRVTASILNRLNLNQFVCEDIFQFGVCAAKLSSDNSARQKFRKNLRGTMRKSTLMDNEQFANEFTSAIRSAWQRWCEKGYLGISAN